MWWGWDCTANQVLLDWTRKLGFRSHGSNSYRLYFARLWNRELKRRNMDQFLVQLEQSNIQCSLLTCNLGEAQTASLISADSGLKARILIGSITQTDTCTNTCNSKSDLRKIRKSKGYLVGYLHFGITFTKIIPYKPCYIIWPIFQTLGSKIFFRFSYGW